MSRKFLTFWLLLSLGAISFAPPLASAGSQHPPKRKVVSKNGPTTTEESVTLNGVLQRVTSAQIEVLVDSPAKGDQKQKNKNAPHGTWNVATPRGTKFHVEGEATPDYLRSGLLIQFNAKVEGREIKEPIHALTVITKVHRPAHPPAAGTKPAGKSTASSAAVSGSEAAKIVGQLGHTQGNKWPVHVGDKSYPIELADDLKIKVALSNSHLISVGDKIVIHGQAIHGNQGACIADDVTVTLAQPLSAKSKPKSSEHEPGPSSPEKTGLPEKK